uniref:Transposase n=1 Tax=Heterorhabditis bacteriophora TaxID=37862 RepID=A0A1I7WSN5_HETBA
MFKAPLTTVTHLHEKGQENAKKLCATRMALHRTVKLYQEISILKKLVYIYIYI